MRTLTAAIIAILTIVLVFFGFGLRGNTGRAVAQQAVYTQSAPPEVQAVPAAPTGGAQVVPVGGDVQAAAGWATGAQQPVLVNCGPGAQTLVRPVWMNGQQVSQVECVPMAGGVAYATPAVAQTVAYGGPVYSTPVPVRTYAPVRRRVVQPRRSWQKTALVIGGSTATGAGIGALIGGKKGALIGAAIGGGASTIYESGKRK